MYKQVKNSKNGKQKLHFKGTMQIDAMVGLGDSTILVSDVSCYRAKCMTGEEMCDSWKREKWGRKTKKL